jgi:Ala-tRNA(Pro) deacylase
LRNTIGANGNLSFGNAELLYETLGVRPGAVTPFAVINNTKADTNMVLSRDVLANEYINAHPLHNRATATISSSDLLKFLIACGYPPTIIELP